MGETRSRWSDEDVVSICLPGVVRGSGYGKWNGRNERKPGDGGRQSGIYDGTSDQLKSVSAAVLPENESEKWVGYPRWGEEQSGGRCGGSKKARKKINTMPKIQWTVLLEDAMFGIGCQLGFLIRKTLPTADVNYGSTQ